MIISLPEVAVQARFEMSQLKYLAAFTVPLVTFTSLWWPAYLCFGSVVYAFGIIPFAELILPTSQANFSSEQEASARRKKLYDFMLYLLVPVQYALLGLLLYRVTYHQLTVLQIIGMTASMGVTCGAIGINVAHELGHRVTKFERCLAQMLLLTSLYMHFSIEHNRGHHKNVATPGDPSTARRNEWLYPFWLRTISGVFISAWKIEFAERRKQGHWAFGLRNQMLQILIIESLAVAVVAHFFGPSALVCFLASALIGVLVLETVNYIEHYGLLRQEVSPGKFERVQPWHSWNSDHLLGRIILFELTRHADHHYSASRPYQILRHMPEGPQMPFGYPAAMLLATIPPLWFRVMNPRLRARPSESVPLEA